MIQQIADIPGANVTAEVRDKMCPYIHLVPKTLAENLAFREAMLKAAAKDPQVADALWFACKADPLFFINTFIWTLDPRRTSCPELPMITWEGQDAVLLELVACVGNYDLWCEKSRCQGFTWNVLMAFLWRFLFYDNSHMLCATRNEKLVDSLDEPNSLFPKIDFALKWLPEFLKPPINRVMMKFVNEENGSTITGEANTDDIGRGGRQLCIFVDEFAAFGKAASAVMGATAAVARSRIFGSTHKGTGTVFYRNVKQAGKKVLRVHWTTNPFQTPGLYTSKDGELVLLDTEFRAQVYVDAQAFTFPDDYPFILDGKIRSPYYDNECARLGHNKVLIAQELDINPVDSAATFFEAPILDRMLALARKKSVLHVGDPSVDWATGEWLDFYPTEKGCMRLWVPLDLRGKLPSHEYVLGIDVATGTGGEMSSNSVISIGDKWTREKVGELATFRMTPDELATIAYAMGTWLSWEDTPALIIWENQGPGRLFTKRLTEMAYPNLYMQQNIDRLGNPSTDRPGWAPTKSSKMTLLGRLRTAYKNGEFANPSPEAIEECYHYQFTDDGEGVAHALSLNAEDATGAKANHGDRVIADALMWYVIPAKIGNAPVVPTVAPVGSMAWRRERRYERSMAASRW